MILITVKFKKLKEEIEMRRVERFKPLVYLFLVITGAIYLQGCVVSQPQPVYYTPVTVPDIVKMTKDGVPTNDIINEMQKSHTVYWLKADQLAKLKGDGVADSVINYMEDTHIEAVRQNQALQNSYYWWPGWDGYYYGGPAFGWPYNFWILNWGPAVVFSDRFYFGGGFHGGGYHGRGGGRRR